MSTTTDSAIDLNAFSQEITEAASSHALVSLEVSSHPNEPTDKKALLEASRDAFYEATFEVTLAAINKVLGNKSLVKRVIEIAHGQVAENLFRGAGNGPAIWKQELTARIAMLLPPQQNT